MNHFFCKSDPHHLVEFFIGALERLALQSEAQIKLMFLDIETIIMIRLGRVQEKLNQSQRQERTVETNVIQNECEDEECAFVQFLQMQKNKLFDLQDHLERYYKILPIFGFNSAKYDLNLIISYLLRFSSINGTSNILLS